MRDSYLAPYIALYRSPSLLRHIWSCMKVLSYPTVVFSVLCHFGLKCRTSEFFQDNGLFQCNFVGIMEARTYDRTFLLKIYVHNVS